MSMVQSRRASNGEDDSYYEDGSVSAEIKPVRDLICIGCGKAPHELDEYISASSEIATGVKGGMKPEDYVWEEEGTLNRENGHFLCTECYIKAGQPSSSRGWIAP